MVAVLTLGPWPMANTGTPFLGPGLWFVGALLAGALVVALIRRWQRHQPNPTASDQLAHFRALYEKGQLTEEEFKRLRAVLSDELRRSLNLPNAPPAAPNVPPETPDPPAPGIKPG